MAGKIMDGLFSSVYFRVSVLIMLCFFGAIWYVNTSVEKEAMERVNTMITDAARNNIEIMTNMLDDYNETLIFIKENISDSNGIENIQTGQKILQQMGSRDSSIYTLYMEPLDTVHNNNDKVWREVYKTGGKTFFKFATAANNHTQLSLLVDLQGFHNRVAETKWASSTYITIIYDSIYLYHPDESKIATFINEQDSKYQKSVLSSRRDTIVNTTSDFLKLPVYSYYSTPNKDNSQWLFTANLPDLGLSDSIKETANNFLIISLLAVCSFIAVFSLGIHRWRKEVIRRREFEQQNMNLLLKSEQHKQTMISTELERLKSGLNPHFLFNSLGSLRVLITKDAETAKYFAITLSNVYRYMLKQENQDTVTLREELEFTENYINLQKIRFANKIITDISLSEEDLNHKVLPISLQLLVENCIKHTQVSDSEPLHIRIFVEGDMLVVVNNYNPREHETEHSGKGIDNLIRRYSFLTKTECTFNIEKRCYFAKIPLLLHS